MGEPAFASWWIKIPLKHSAACCTTQPNNVIGAATPASGMDTISAGATVACAMELFEVQALGEKEAGRPLRFGDATAMVELMTEIGYRQGFGDVLAEGAHRVARKYDRPDLFIGVK